VFGFSSKSSKSYSLKLLASIVEAEVEKAAAVECI
jgi:hypothetical protein